MATDYKGKLRQGTDYVTKQAGNAYNKLKPKVSSVVDDVSRRASGLRNHPNVAKASATAGQATARVRTAAGEAFNQTKAAGRTAYDAASERLRPQQPQPQPKPRYRDAGTRRFSVPPDPQATAQAQDQVRQNQARVTQARAAAASAQPTQGPPRPPIDRTVGAPNSPPGAPTASAPTGNAPPKRPFLARAGSGMLRAGARLLSAPAQGVVLGATPRIANAGEDQLLQQRDAARAPEYGLVQPGSREDNQLRVLERMQGMAPEEVRKLVQSTDTARLLVGDGMTTLDEVIADPAAVRARLVQGLGGGRAQAAQAAQTAPGQPQPNPVAGQPQAAQAAPGAAPAPQAQLRGTQQDGNYAPHEVEYGRLRGLPAGQVAEITGAPGFRDRIRGQALRGEPAGGAFSVVSGPSQEQLDATERNVESLNRGTAAIRSLRAARLGVPEDTLEMIDSGSSVQDANRQVRAERLAGLRGPSVDAKNAAARADLTLRGAEFSRKVAKDQRDANKDAREESQAAWDRQVDHLTKFHTDSEGKVNEPALGIDMALAANQQNPAYDFTDQLGINARNYALEYLRNGMNEERGVFDFVAQAAGGSGPNNTASLTPSFEGLRVEENHVFDTYAPFKGPALVAPDGNYMYLSNIKDPKVRALIQRMVQADNSDTPRR